MLSVTVGTCLEFAPISLEFMINDVAPELLLLEFLITFRLLEELL